jgi:hypothetical protein
MTDYDKRLGFPTAFRPPVRTSVDGVPVYNFGYASFYAESPTLTDDVVIQAGNNNTSVKIHPKKSWEIKSNRIGACPPRLPCTPVNDYQPLECINLIDGNDETCWASMPAARADTDPVWIRIDLAKERRICKIVLKKRPITFDRWAKPGSQRLYEGAVEVGRAMPKNLTVRLSVDAHSWVTVFEGETDDNPARDSFVLSFPPRASKQIWVVGNILTRCEGWMYAFSIASIELYDEQDCNVALLTYGNGVTVSSTHHNEGNERETRQWYWPLQFDLGLKWARFGFHDDLVNWHWIEKEKGILEIDEEAEKGIRVLGEHGVNVIFGLGFGNRLYQEDPVRHLPQLWEWYYENPEPPKSDEALAAWCRYVRFCVVRFRDSVKYFEIWNEWNGEIYWGDTPDVYHYIKLAKLAIPIIRECAPEARIMLGSYAGFCHGIHAWSSEELAEKEKTNPLLIAITELGRDVDVIGYHPMYQMDTTSDTYRHYAESVKTFITFCKAKGFRGGEYMVTEFGFGANYPPTDPYWWGSMNYSEIEKAKIVAQIDILHTALGVESFFCGLWTGTYPLDISLLRKSFVSYPVTSYNPQAAYFVTRNLATALEDLLPASFGFDMVGDTTDLEAWAMGKEGEKVLAVWLTGIVTDDCAGRELSFIFNFVVESAVAYNPLNGELTALNISWENGRTAVRSIIVRDYPLLIRLTV